MRMLPSSASHAQEDLTMNHHLECTSAPLINEWMRGLHAVFIGASMGATAFCVDILLEKLNNWKFGAVVAVIRARGGFWLPYLTLLAFCLGYCALAGAIPSYVAPLSAGSGIPEIKSYLNGVRIRGAPVAAMCCCCMPLLAVT